MYGRALVSVWVTLTKARSVVDATKHVSVALGVANGIVASVKNAAKVGVAWSVAVRSGPRRTQYDRPPVMAIEIQRPSAALVSVNTVRVPGTRVSAAIPVPDASIVFAPLVWLASTVTVPAYRIREIGANVTVTGCDPPAMIVPFDQLPLNPVGKLMLVTVSVEFPVFEMVSVLLAVMPSGTFPNARLPCREMILDDEG
jgi:hypothetical protein